MTVIGRLIGGFILLCLLGTLVWILFKLGGIFALVGVGIILAFMIATVLRPFM